MLNQQAQSQAGKHPTPDRRTISQLAQEHRNAQARSGLEFNIRKAAVALGLDAAAAAALVSRSRAAFIIADGLPVLAPATAAILSQGQQGHIPSVEDWVQAVVSRAAVTTRQNTRPLPEKNPFSKATWNITEQMRIQKRNPDLAVRLRAEAHPESSC